MFETTPNTPENKCTLGYNPEESECTVLLPNKQTIKLISVTLTEPNNRDSFLSGFCPDANEQGEVHLIEEFGRLTVKKVTIEGEVLFEAPTIH